VKLLSEEVVFPFRGKRKGKSRKGATAPALEREIYLEEVFYGGFLGRKETPEPFRDRGDKEKGRSRKRLDPLLGERARRWCLGK